MKNFISSLIFILMSISIFAQQSVVDIVVNSPDHETLEAAVIAADLAGTLSGEGPFTVFAPTDDAFAALPDGTIEALLADPSGALTDILTYHVIAADVRSTDLSDGQIATTINGADITVTINTDGVFINDAQVTVVDLVADNGVVHVIDAVLLPNTSSNSNINDFAKVHVYPNPATTNIKIETNGFENETLSYSIYNTVGKSIVPTQLLPSSGTINIQEHNQGNYYIVIQSKTKRFVKQFAIK